MALLAMSGVHGYEAAKLLGEIGVEIDSRGGIILDPAKAAERRKYRRKRQRGRLPRCRGATLVSPHAPATALSHPSEVDARACRSIIAEQSAQTSCSARRVVGPPNRTC